MEQEEGTKKEQEKGWNEENGTGRNKEIEEERKKYIIPLISDLRAGSVYPIFHFFMTEPLYHLQYWNQARQITIRNWTINQRKTIHGLQ